ncbi:MAG: hypothetical protein B6D56_05085 [Candidatus Omnitrophica bacterium 4484_70.1]|nr:MAG: hypothetical protein B6D56_05085 [Candidatus Omnitrophica bacterium 4484_70.1]
MKRKNLEARFEVFSVGIIVFITFLSLIRFNYLPQFIDGYYHLSVANGFMKSGGWVGWDWWDFSPWGRPHLYPPLYHFILVFLKKVGVSGINSLRLTESLITPLFFFVLWRTSRKLVSSQFSFFVLLTLSSFFSFYSSVSANVPSSIAIIFGLLAWRFLLKKKVFFAVFFLTLAFYTHPGIPWIFTLSILFLALLNKPYRKLSLLLVFFSLIFASPLIFHQIKYITYVNLSILHEVKFIHFSIFILILSLFSIFILNKKGKLSEPVYLLFLGYTVASLVVFFKYPYRFFSSQGILGLGLLSSLLWMGKKVRVKSMVVAYLFFLHSTFDLNQGKLEINLFNSTYYNFLSGRVFTLLEFTSLFYPDYYQPVIKVIEKYTKEDEIVSSNLSITSQIFSSLTNRPSSNSILGEVNPLRKKRKLELLPSYSLSSPSNFIFNEFVKLVVWIKPMKKEIEEKINKGRLIKVYENDVTCILINPYCHFRMQPIPSPINFSVILVLFVFFILLFILKPQFFLKK